MVHKTVSNLFIEFTRQLEEVLWTRGEIVLIRLQQLDHKPKSIVQGERGHWRRRGTASCTPIPEDDVKSEVDKASMAPPGPRIWRRGEVKPLKEEVLDKLWNKKSMTKKTGRDSTVCVCESLCHVPLASYLPPLCTALIRRLLLMTPSHRRAMPPPPRPSPLSPSSCWRR